MSLAKLVTGNLLPLWHLTMLENFANYSSLQGSHSNFCMPAQPSTQLCATPWPQRSSVLEPEVVVSLKSHLHLLGKQEDLEFEAILGYLARLSQKTKV
jgi:hypothetical protein